MLSVVALAALLAGTTVAEPSVRAEIRYEIRANETLESIAARFGVQRSELCEWNDIPCAQGVPERGTVLRIVPARFARPRQLRKIRLEKRDSWDSVALRYGLNPTELKEWNPRYVKRRRLPVGGTLVLRLPSGVERYPQPSFAAELEPGEAPAGGLSIGRPHRGRLHNGAKLAESPDYTVRFAYQSYGSTLTIRNLRRAIAAFRGETGFAGAVMIGALSRRSGRRLRPHRSHQSGRDVDIRMPAMGHARGYKLLSHEVDWYATFALIDALTRTGVVQVIFVERKFHRRLRKAGMRLGASDARIKKVMAHVRHSKGHTSHIHVRFECAPDNERCKAV